MAITLLLTELLVELGGEVDRAVGKVECVIGVLNATKLASDICEPMWRSGAARHGWVKGLGWGVGANASGKPVERGKAV